MPLFQPLFYNACFCKRNCKQLLPNVSCKQLTIFLFFHFDTHPFQKSFRSPSTHWLFGICSHFLVFKPFQLAATEAQTLIAQPHFTMCYFLQMLCFFFSKYILCSYKNSFLTTVNKPKALRLKSFRLMKNVLLCTLDKDICDEVGKKVFF